MENVIPTTGSMKRAGHCLRCIPGTPRDREDAGGAGFALRLAREGQWVRIVSLAGGKGCQDRLAGMGLRIGGEMQVLRNDMGGKLLLGHKGDRLFLGGGMAHKIQVTVIKGENR